MKANNTLKERLQWTSIVLLIVAALVTGYFGMDANDKILKGVSALLMSVATFITLLDPNE